MRHARLATWLLLLWVPGITWGVAGCRFDPKGTPADALDAGGDAVCGDSVLEGAEACDDGNVADGDGCSAACAVEPGYSCMSEPSVCTFTCSDGFTNGDETDVDCGGSCPVGCEIGQACGGHTDCVSGYCEGIVCAVPSCTDGSENGDETDVDCGGSCPVGCQIGQGCAQPQDCLSGHCVLNLCAPHPCADGLHNGDELDIDCGGSCPDPCTRIFLPDPEALVILELNGDTFDVAGGGRDPVLLGGTFVPTGWGQGLSLPGTDPQGIDWSAFTNMLTHPYTVEMVLVPSNTDCYRKLFSFADNNDDGWYYCDGFRAFPNDAIGGSFPANVRHYLALVSTAPDAVDLYYNGVYVDSTGATFAAPPAEAIFFRDDSATGRGEILTAVVDGLRLSGVARTVAEIAAVQQRLDAQPHVP